MKSSTISFGKQIPFKSLHLSGHVRVGFGKLGVYVCVCVCVRLCVYISPGADGRLAHVCVCARMLPVGGYMCACCSNKRQLMQMSSCDQVEGRRRRLTQF